MPAPAIDSLVREVADVFGRRSDPKLAADALSECVRRVTAQGFFLDERHLGGSADGLPATNCIATHRGASSS